MNTNPLVSQRAENIELAALRDLHAAATAEDRRQLGLETFDIGSSFVSIAAGLPESAIVINRCLGTGLTAPATRDEISAIVDAYARNRIAQYFLQLHPEARPAELKTWLLQADLRPDRGWQKFARGNAVIEPRSTDLRVREIDAEFGSTFAEIVCPAFDLGEAAIPWLTRLPGRDGWHVFMSFDGNRAAGVGALFVRDGYGWTDWGATAAEFRQRGSQSAIMSARLERAQALGCDQVFTCTGVSVPGDPQHSYGNILRAGFSETYVRDNYVPA